MGTLLIESIIETIDCADINIFESNQYYMKKGKPRE